MNLPEVKTLKKIRDGKICAMYLEGIEKQVIADKFNLCERQINRILYRNSTVLKNILQLTKDSEKVKKIMWLKKQILISKKLETDQEMSPLTLMDELAKELEVNNGQPTAGETRVIIIRESNGNQGQDRSVSRPLSILKV